MRSNIKLITQIALAALFVAASVTIGVLVGPRLVNKDGGGNDDSSTSSSLLGSGQEDDSSSSPSLVPSGGPTMLPSQVPTLIQSQVPSVTPVSSSIIDIFDISRPFSHVYLSLLSDFTTIIHAVVGTIHNAQFRRDRNFSAVQNKDALGTLVSTTSTSMKCNASSARDLTQLWLFFRAVFIGKKKRVSVNIALVVQNVAT